MKTTTEPPRSPERLAASLVGDVDFGEPTRTLYSTDASIYQVTPAGVVFPVDRDDVRKTVQYARERGTSITPRGASSSLTGNAVGAGIVLDCERHMDGIVSVDPEAKTATVQPGVVLDRLNERLAEDGLYFPPDPSTSSTCTIGGMVANDAAGAHSVRHGTTRENVHSVECVFADGTIATLERLAGDRLDSVLDRDDHFGALVRTLRSVGRTHSDEIANRYPNIERNSSGYDLETSAAADGSWVDPSRVIVGSEGTLGVITEVTLELTERPETEATALVFYQTVIEAAVAVEFVLKADPSAVELIDADVLGYAQTAWGIDLIPPDAEAALLIEVEGAAAGIETHLENVVAEATTDSTIEAERATIEERRHTLWKIRTASNPLLNRRPGDEQALSFIEDAAVPPERLPEYLDRVRDVLIEHELDASVFGHAGQGVLHVKPFLNLQTERDRERLQSVSEDVHSIVLDIGGCVSGEHGDGQLRSQYLEAMYGETLYSAFEELKQAVDPEDVFNPAKVVPDSEGRLVDVESNLRFDGYDSDAVETALDFGDEGGMASLIEQCNGCSKCRATGDGVMCPSYRADEDELLSTRGRANALRAAIDGRLGEDAITSDWFIEGVLDRCLACKACETECPTGVDMAKLKTELKHKTHQKDGIPLRSRVFANVRELNRVGSALSPIANRLASISMGRSALERVLGIDRRRELPTFAAESFLQWFDRHDPDELAGENGRVVLFPDCYMTYNHPEVGRAAVTLLERCGYSVEMPDVACCGRPALSQGMVDHARDDANENVALLEQYAADDIPILAGEPSCVSALKEYDDLLADDRGVSGAAGSVSAFVASEAMGSLRALDFGSTDEHVAVHTHCHSAAKGFEGAPIELLEVAGYTVDVVESTCCGMAGSFGYETEHYDLSQSLGETLDAKLTAIDPDVVVTTGESCSQQLSHFDRETVHPLVLLAGGNDA